MSWTVVQIFGDSGECFTFTLPSVDVNFNIDFNNEEIHGIEVGGDGVLLLHVDRAPEWFTGVRVVSIKNVEHLFLSYQKSLPLGGYDEEVCPDPEMGGDKARRFHPGDDISSFIQKHELTPSDRIFLRCGKYESAELILRYDFKSDSWVNSGYSSEN